jgi:hypothetical protein
MNVLISLLFALGIAGGAGLFAMALIQGLVRAPDLISSAAYQAEQTLLHPVGVGEFAPDLAYPFYPFRQVRADLGQVNADLSGLYRRLAKWPVDAFLRGRHGERFWWWLFFPIPVSILSWLVVTGLTSAACFGVFAAINLLGAAAVGAAHRALTGLALGVDLAWRVAMHTEASCPQCFHVTRRPAYVCPACATWHRDIRPGKLGLAMRRCQCGKRLPTMPLRAAWQLQAVCQYDKCGQHLPRGAGALRNVRIVIFGDTSAGKTRFLYASLNSLVSGTGPVTPAVDFPDAETRREVDQGLDIVRSGQDTVKTTTGLPFAVTCRLGRGWRATLVHLFDTAGENYRDVLLHDALGFLHEGHGFIYVLDPFAIPSVRNRLAGNNSEAVRLAHAAAGNPESAYVDVASRLRDGGVPADRQRLAVIISKADLLRASGVEIPAGSALIAQWLTEAGLHNVVIGAQRDFAQVRYFAVASQPATGAHGQDDPGAPLRWLLRAYGTPLPGSPDVAGEIVSTSPASPPVSEDAKAVT